MKVKIDVSAIRLPSSYEYYANLSTAGLLQPANDYTLLNGNPNLAYGLPFRNDILTPASGFRYDQQVIPELVTWDLATYDSTYSSKRLPKIAVSLSVSSTLESPNWDSAIQPFADFIGGQFSSGGYYIPKILELEELSTGEYIARLLTIGDGSIRSSSNTTPSPTSKVYSIVFVCPVTAKQTYTVSSSISMAPYVSPRMIDYQEAQAGSTGTIPDMVFYHNVPIRIEGTNYIEIAPSRSTGVQGRLVPNAKLGMWKLQLNNPQRPETTTREGFTTAIPFFADPYNGVYTSSTADTLSVASYCYGYAVESIGRPSTSYYQEPSNIISIEGLLNSNDPDDDKSVDGSAI